MQSILNESEADVWPQIAPLLDDALGRLAEKDRHAIVLRYFENKSLGEVGVALGASEDAAKVRVHRALEKLRKFFTRRGVALPTTLIAGAVAANSVQAAPAGLTISAVAAAKGSVAAASTLTLVKGALKLMAWQKAKIAIGGGVVVLIAVGTAAVFIHAQNPEVKGRGMIARHEAMPIDLTAYYTYPASIFAKATRFPGWKTVPVGFHLFANVPLQIDGQLTLWGEQMATKLKSVDPEEVSGIPLNRKFGSLYFYHATFYVSPDGTPVYKVVLHYDDGSSVTNQILFGRDVLDWSVKPSDETILAPTARRSRIAWIGGWFSPKQTRPLRFALTEIENLQPSREVASIDLISCKSPSAPCIMAITTGRSGLMNESPLIQPKPLE